MTLSQPEFNYVRRLVLDQSAIVLEEDKGYLVESRLLPLARREGFHFHKPPRPENAIRASERPASPGGRGNDHKRNVLLSRFSSVRRPQKICAAGSYRPARTGKKVVHLVCCKFVRAGALQPQHADSREFSPVVNMECPHPGNGSFNGYPRSGARGTL